MPQELSNLSGQAYRAYIPVKKVIAAVNPVRPEGGAQAQHIVVPAASVVPIPEGVSLAQASILLMTGLTALNAREIAALKKGQILAVSGGAGLLAQYAIAAAKRQGIKVIADANPADAELVRSYGGDIVVGRGPGFAEAIRRELPNGVDALLDTAALGEQSFGAIRDGGIDIPVRGWGDKPAEREIKDQANDEIRCPRTYRMARTAPQDGCSRGDKAARC